MGRIFSVKAQSDSEAFPTDSGREKIKVALISIGAALFLIGAKGVVGFLTGSLALLAEAAHSGLDLLASVVTAFSVKAADRPADSSHHYGHGKIESLSALFEAALLFAACVWILHEGVTRLTHPVEVPIINIYSFAVVVLAIVIDLYRYKALIKVARKYHSQALEADAIHFYSDILSSILVLIGLAAVALGYPRADAVAALFVAVWVGLLAIRIALKNIDILIDRVPEGYSQQIRDLALSNEGIVAIDKLRVRRSGSYLFADLRVGMDRNLSFDEAHRVARLLERSLAEKIPGLDAVVHMNPRALPHESIELGILHLIDSLGLQAHHLALHRYDEQFKVELHLEVPGNLTLGEAHAQATDIELKILNDFYEVESVQIHIEESGDKECGIVSSEVKRPEIVAKINAVSDSNLGEGKCHNIIIIEDAGNLSASMHCYFSADLNVTEIHKQTTHLENEMLRLIPELTKVLVHAEPLKSP